MYTILVQTEIASLCYIATYHLRSLFMFFLKMKILSAIQYDGAHEYRALCILRAFTCHVNSFVRILSQLC